MTAVEPTPTTTPATRPSDVGRPDALWGYTLVDIDRLATQAARIYAASRAGDFRQPYEAAWDRIVEILTTEAQRPDPGQLVMAGRYAVYNDIGVQRRHHGQPTGGREGRETPSFARYWALATTTPSHEAAVVDRVALEQIWPILPDTDRDTLLALAAHADHRSAAAALGITTTFGIRLRQARQRFQSWWHEHETPPQPRTHAARYEQREQARTMRAEGVSIRKIGVRLGVHRDTITRWVADLDANGGPVAYHGDRHADRDRARAMRAEGASLPKIAAALGTTVPTVLGWTHDIASYQQPQPDRQAQRAQARSMRTQGATLKAITETLGVSKPTVKIWTQEITAPNPRQADHDRARALRRQGATLADIAADLGVHTDTVARWLRQPDHHRHTPTGGRAGPGPPHPPAPDDEAAQRRREIAARLLAAEHDRAADADRTIERDLIHPGLRLGATR